MLLDEGRSCQRREFDVLPRGAQVRREVVSRKIPQNSSKYQSLNAFCGNQSTQFSWVFGSPGNFSRWFFDVWQVFGDRPIQPEAGGAFHGGNQGRWHKAVWHEAMNMDDSWMNMDLPKRYQFVILWYEYVMMIHDVQSCPIADRSTLRGSRRGGLQGTLAELGSWSCAVTSPRIWCSWRWTLVHGSPSNLDSCV